MATLSLAHTVKSIAPVLVKSIPPAPKLQGSTLYQVISRLPGDGVGYHVVQSRWIGKGIEGSYWHVTKVRIWDEGMRGRVWGRLIWKGKLVSPKDEKLSGGLKYRWKVITDRPQHFVAPKPSTGPQPLRT